MTFSHVERVREAIRQHGPREAFSRLIAENDAWIRKPDLHHGRALVTARSEIYLELVRHWAAAEHMSFGYDRPFAVVALGGTGRAEITPHSDNDFGLLFEDPLEGNAFRVHLQDQVLHTRSFRERYGFDCQIQPFSLDDLPRLVGKQLNTFIDLRAVYDPGDIVPKFRERIRSTFDPFEHFLHVRHFWKDQWEKAAGQFERLDRFDIKNDGLRVFLAGVWTLAGQRFVHSETIYRRLEDPRDLEAYDFLLRIRAFVHLRKGPGRPLPDGSHPQDILTFDDFASFGELRGEEASERERFEFGCEIRARLLSARRRVAAFTKGVIERELKYGRPVSAGSNVIYGVSGLYHNASAVGLGPREQSRAALTLLLESQRHGVPVDPSELQGTFRNAGDWLTLVPELSALFYEPRGSLADSMDFLAQFDGAQGRLFPGYSAFEASLDGRVLTEKASLRGVLERRKLRQLESHVQEGRARLADPAAPTGGADFIDSSGGVSIPIEAALLDADHLAAVKLALHTKRLPLTPDDLKVRSDPRSSLYELYSSGMSNVPLADYYTPYQWEADFTPETIRVVRFLVEHRRAFKDRYEAGPNDATQVAEFAQLCQNEQRLRSLFVFTCADRAEWESETEQPARWFCARELYTKAMARFRPGQDANRSLASAGYSAEQLDILRDFGEDFFTGSYRQYAHRFGSHLVRLAEGGEEVRPRAGLVRSGASMILGVAARDYRGLAASISGALFHAEVELAQAHLFSAMRYGLALDFFHVAPGGRPAGTEVAKAVEEAIRNRRFIGDADEAQLPRMVGVATLSEWRPGQCCLRFESREHSRGVIYALTYRVFRHLRGNIFGLTAHAARGRTYVSVYHSLPPDLALDDARSLVAERFAAP